MFLIAAGAVDPSGLWSQVITFFSPDSSGAYPNIFPGLPGLVEDARKPFYLVAFVFLVYYLVDRFSHIERFSGGAFPIIKAAACVFCIAFTSSLINTTSDTMEDLSKSIGTEATPAKIISSMDQILMSYADSTQGSSSSGTESKGWLDSVLHPGKALEAGMDAITQSVQMLAVSLFVGIVSLFFKLAELVVLLLHCLRFLIVQLSSIFLPVMFAMTMVGAVKSVGHRYIMSLVGVLGWPIAWGFGNLGTQALLTSISEKMATPSLDLISYVWIGVILVVIPIWVAVVYIGGPLLVAKMVTTGANLAQAAVAGSAAGAVGLGGAAAVGGVAATGAAVGNSARGMKSFQLAGSAGAGSAGGGGTSTPRPAAQGATSRAHNRSVAGSGGASSSGGSSTPEASDADAGAAAGAVSMTAAALEHSAQVVGANMAQAVNAVQAPLADLAAAEGLSPSQVMARATMPIVKRPPTPPIPPKKPGNAK